MGLFSLASKLAVAVYRERAGLRFFAPCYKRAVPESLDYEPRQRYKLKFGAGELVGVAR